jgi:hypothetical protein
MAFLGELVVKNMKVNLMPKTNLGRWSIGFIVVMPILFYLGFSLARGLYQSVPAGKTIIADISARPVLALSMLTGNTCGIAAFFTGIQALIKEKERSIFVIISTIVGGLVLLFLAGEIVFPH